MKQIAKRAMAMLLSALMVLGCILGLAPKAQAAIKGGRELIAWDFNNKNFDGWHYGDGWDSTYHGSKPCKVYFDRNSMCVDVNYGNDADNGWAQIALSLWRDSGKNLNGANRMTMDLTYYRARLTGEMSIRLWCNSGVNTGVTIDNTKGEDIGGGLARVKLKIDFDELTDARDVHDWNILLVGHNTTYYGPIWIDNVSIQIADPSDDPDDPDDIYVNVIQVPTDYAPITVSDGNLVTRNANGGRQATPLSTSVKMVDGKADEATRRTYAYLEAMGKSDSVIFGHQGNTWWKAGAANLSFSDTMDVVGSYSGIAGMDVLELAGVQYSTYRYKEQFGVEYEDTVENRVKVAALLSNWNIEQGILMTLSAHMPNFAKVENQEAPADAPSYARYNFNDATFTDFRGDTANRVLPGGDLNDVYNAYLDMIADYAHQVNGAVLFRPLHENTGSWFWWGAAFCDAETYKNLYRYTVEYLRDEQNVHNFIYLYGPGSEAESVEDYVERYPGDAWVDMVGFDMYHADPVPGDGWLEQFEEELTIVNDFATAHSKLIAVTETGAARSAPVGGDSTTALLKSGNEYVNWYQDVQEIVSKKSNASYMLTWNNFSTTSGFYTPYVVSTKRDGTLHGHELMDSFIDYFNDPRSVFAVNQRDVIGGSAISATATAAGDLTGYFVSPVAGARILEETTITARVTGAGAGASVQFVLTGADGTVMLNAARTSGAYYSATLSQAQLDALGVSSGGKLKLLVDGKALTEQLGIFKIPAPVADPYVVDDFESYLGVEALMLREWTTNKASGSAIDLTLTNTAGQAQNGYAMKLTYSEQSGGWAGATISKEANWSDRNALQFWTVPDANAQKVVIQLTAGDTVYEVYLNDYADYAKNAGKPVLVTIPFAEFVARDIDGQPKGGLAADAGSLGSFGIWVNAVDNAAFHGDTVSGSIWYDNIRAVTSDATAVTILTP